MSTSTSTYTLHLQSHTHTDDIRHTCFASTVSCSSLSSHSSHITHKNIRALRSHPRHAAWRLCPLHATVLSLVPSVASLVCIGRIDTHVRLASTGAETCLTKDPETSESAKLAPHPLSRAGRGALSLSCSPCFSRRRESSCHYL